MKKLAKVKKCNGGISNDTLQQKLIHSIDNTELLNNAALKDIRNRILDMIFAYSGNMDMNSLQILMQILMETFDHAKSIKQNMAENYVKHELEMFPSLKKHVNEVLNQKPKTEQLLKNRMN